MSDHELQRQVQDALEWEPSVDAARVGVSVHDGIVTLQGEVGSFGEQTMAERVALRVHGVKGVANDIEVRFEGTPARTDTELAAAVVHALEWASGVPARSVTVTVNNHWVTLAGTVDRHHERETAFKVIRALAGVRGVTNNIAVRDAVPAGDVKDKIEAALRRNAMIDADRVHVTVHGNIATLDGQVHSWDERQAAVRSAWAAPGITMVEDHLRIAY